MDVAHRHDHENHPLEPELDALEARTAIPMLILSAGLVPLLIVPLILNLTPQELDFIDALEWSAWSMFSVEYIARFIVARNKKHFFLHNLIDLATVLLPLLRPLRLINSARALRLLRAGRIVAVGLRSGKQSERMVNHRSVTITATVVASLISCLAAMLYDVEHTAPHGNIKSVAEAFWCAVSTVSSTGYGDYYPTTGEGRCIAAALMFIGTCLSGLIAAAFASTFIEQKNEQEFDPQLLEIREHLNRLDSMLLRLEEHNAITPRGSTSPERPE